MRFVVDVAAHRYSAYVTPPGGGEITIGTNLAFRTEQQAVTSLDTRTVAAGIGSLQACDLQISGASDTPSTTTVFALGDGADGSSASRALAGYVQAQNPDRFFYLGDVYATGTADEFARTTTRPTARWRTRPIPSSETTRTRTGAAATTPTGNRSAAGPQTRRSIAPT